MGYLVLARKWRPRRFDDLVGQGPIVQILANAIDQNKLSHAYIFAGPRGVGKTTTARILAMGLNCIEGPTHNPCGVCESCVSITDGSSVDVLEIDGASNNSVDDIRDLRERVKYAASGGKHKVYIIDEVHMLSTSAFNALLKTLEEPPPHVVFVLATTEARKIPATVLSRCQHLPFRRVTASEIKGRLSYIVKTDNIGITDGALDLVCRAADGSMRDSLTILDQVISFSDHVVEDDVKSLLDISDFSTMHELALSCVSGDRAKMLGIVADLVGRGTDLRSFSRELIKHFRDLLVCRVAKGSAEQLLELTSEETASMVAAAEHLSEEHLSLILTELIKAEGEIKFSSWPRVALEMALIKVSYLSTFNTLKDAISALSHGGARVVEPLAALKLPPQKPAAHKKAPELAFAAKPIMDAIDDTPVDDDSLSDEEPPLIDPLILDDDPEIDSGVQLMGSMDATAVLNELLRQSGDASLPAFLSNATVELKEDILTVRLTGSDATIKSLGLQGMLKQLNTLASEIRHTPTQIIIHKEASKPQSPLVDMKTKVMADKTVIEIMDLFDGRLVDYKLAEE